MWVRDVELVEVVDVREAEDDGGEEDDGCVGGLGEEEEGYRGGAEEDFFGDGALGKQEMLVSDQFVMRGWYENWDNHMLNLQRRCCGSLSIR